MTSEFLSAYRVICDSYKCVTEQINTANEGQSTPTSAIAAYESCQRQIEEILTLPVGLPENVDFVKDEWIDACTTIQKLKNLRLEVANKLKVLREQQSPLDKSAVEATEDLTIQSNLKTYRHIITELRRVVGRKELGTLIHFDTLFSSQAQLYKIQPGSGGTITMAGKTTLSLVLCTTTTQHVECCRNLNGICFIQCSITPNTECSTEPEMIWIYPLIPTVTVCCRTDYGALILPDLESDVPGTAFGIMLATSSRVCSGFSAEKDDDTDQLSDLQTFFFDLLEAVLAGSIDRLAQQDSHIPVRDTSETISYHAVTAADFIARNLIKGAEKTSELMVRSTPYIISKINAAPSDTASVSPALQSSVEVAKNVSSVAAGVTGWVAEKVGIASLALGRFIAPHIHKQGAVILQKSFGYGSTEANNTMEGVFVVAAGAVESFATVYNGLETSAKILGTNLSDNSVKIIEHSYGHSAGNVAAGTFDTIGNAFNVSQNVNYITPKGFAKKMAKNTGKAVVNDYKNKLRVESHFVVAGSLYPDLRSLKDKTQ